MKRQQAFKFKLKPNGQQQRELRRFAGSGRFVFNRALALQQKRFEAGEGKASYSKMCGWLIEWKQSEACAWLKNAPSQTLQQSLRDLERACQNFFTKRAAFPRFKKRGYQDSFRYPQGFKLDEVNNRIFLPKLGWLGYHNSRAVRGSIKNVTVSPTCGQWFVSMQTEYTVEPPQHPGD
jgi:putative transposase